MSQGKLTPRQKMINMMYLVLTALLALNVTREVINAFITIDESIELSKSNIDTKNKSNYAAIDQAYSIDSVKYKDVVRRANMIRQTADDLDKFIDQTKKKLIRSADRLNENDSIPKLAGMKNAEEYDSPTYIMIGNDDENGKKGSAAELKKRLEAYKKVLVENAPEGTRPDYQNHLNTMLNTDDPIEKEDGKRTWELKSFYHNPVVASVALLSKIQSDIRSAEERVSAELYASVDAGIIKVNRFDAKVIPASNVVTLGSVFSAKVFLSASSTTLDPEVFVGATTDSAGSPNCQGCNASVLPVVNGEGIFTDRPVSEGEKTWGGVIRARKPDGTYEHFPFKSSYVAQRPAGVVSAENMNVLYIDLENPVGISVPGVPNDKVFITPQGGGARIKQNREKGAGHYLCEVTTEGKMNFSVAAEIGGNRINMGNYEYRVKRVPKPEATISGTFKGGTVRKEILAAGTLIPILANFEFPIYFVTTEFKMIVANKSVYNELPPSHNSRLTKEMIEAIKNAKPGTKILFENIYARLDKPGTKAQSIPSISFTIQ
jgi:gliding motility-associated protein GldM